MSVLIKGMKMPGKCIDCPFMIGRDNDDCILQSDEANEKFETWDDMKSGCPLIEVPDKHGRLIDADELSGRMHGRWTVYDYEALGLSPTVIEAEGE